MATDALATSIEDIRLMALKGRAQVASFHAYLAVWSVLLALQQFVDVGRPMRRWHYQLDFLIAALGLALTVALFIRQRAATWRSEVMAVVWLAVAICITLLSLGAEIGSHWTSDLPWPSTTMLIAIALGVSWSIGRDRHAAALAGLWLLLGFGLTLWPGYPGWRTSAIIACCIATIASIAVLGLVAGAGGWRTSGRARPGST